MLINDSTPLDQLKFVVFEGINACGKSTVLASIAEILRAGGRRVRTTREPGATNFGISLRQMLLNPPEPISPIAESFLFLADRAQHVASVVRPAIQAGEIVLSDRFYYSTIAFQGYGRGLNIDLLRRLNHDAINGVFPDLVILIDLDVEEAARRIQKRSGSEVDKFEAESLVFQRKVREGFLELARTLPERFVVLDGSKAKEALLEDVKHVMGISA